MSYRTLYYLLIFLFYAVGSTAQNTERVIEERCGTMQRLEERLERDPALRTRFEEQRNSFNRMMREKSATAGNANKEAAVYTIPVVFHIVLPNPSVVTDAQIQAQLDTLNKDYAGTNGDTTLVPSYFKPLFGRSGIQFCLAQRTPDGDNTNGVERIITTRTSFSNTDDAVKHASTGGANSWNSSNYFNVWICQIANNIIGYATFPQDGNESEQGVVIDYRSLPGGSFTAYNGGKTLTHESGHYFNLYHIWGNSDGASCTDSDFVDDTPNQSTSTSGCFTGIRTDNCTPSGNGIMYQNYMDYSNDPCLVMFTNQQVVRMESALRAYRPSLLASNACQPVVLRNLDAQVLSLSQPAQRLCSANFVPAITIRNKGAQTLTSLTITVRIDSTVASTSTWTGSLARSASVAVALNSLTTTTGSHIITVALSQPNGSADEDPTNNVIAAFFQYYPPVTTVTEGFEGTLFPPLGWDVVNPDNNITWQRITGTAKTANGSARIDNLNNTVIGQKDDLRMPTLAIASTIDTAYLSFQVAAAAYTGLSATNNNWDTLEVLVSTDCGITYASVYKKWGSTLVTRQAATTTAFVPAASEWRKDSVNLSSYIGAPNLLVTFRNTSGNENNIYLDDINFSTVTVNPFLKEKGFLATPNPTTGAFTVQFYPQPANLQAIQVWSITGQKLTETLTYGQTRNFYSFNLGGYASGTYIVRAVFSDRVIVRKIVKL